MQFPAKVSQQSSPRKLVLCIDDDKKVLHARKLVLEMAGYKVITASSGGQGLRLLERHPIQLVILDYRMPEMNGEAVTREIRRTHPHVPILMLSGQIDVPKRAASAVDAFVAKGQLPAVLLGHLTALAEGRSRKHPSSTSSGRASNREGGRVES
ncbi:MAG TPA: response regulator [Terriglobales bacterium]|nr:response regulator [Terriglobales bacterium]